MSTSESISNLFNHGVYSIEIGHPPNAGPRFFIAAKQAIPTGDNGNQTFSTHQKVGETIGEILNQVTEQVKAEYDLKREPSGIVSLPNGRG